MRDEEFDNLGSQIKDLRIQMKLTQAEVAAALNVTPGYISNVENNRTKINLRVLTHYARLFHVTVDSILNAGQDHAAYHNILTPLDEEALHMLHQFSPAEQEKIIKILKYIKEAASADQ